MYSEKDLRESYRLEAERAARTAPDFASAFATYASKPSATDHRTWIVAGVAATVVAVAVGVPVVINATSTSPPGVAPAVSAPADPSASTTADSPAPTRTVPTSTAPTRSMPSSSAPPRTSSSANAPRSTGAPSRSSGPTVVGSAAHVVTLPPGTNRMVLREANGSVLCTGVVADVPESFAGPLAVTDTNFVLADAGGLRIDDVMTSPGIVRLRIGGFPIRNVHAQITMESDLTVSADAVRLTIAGRPAYYENLCGAGTLAWQWQPGRWATVVGNDDATHQLTQAMAQQFVAALRSSHAVVPLLPFTVAERPSGTTLVRVGSGQSDLTAIVEGTLPPNSDGTRVWSTSVDYAGTPGRLLTISAVRDQPANWGTGSERTVDGRSARWGNGSLSINAGGWYVVLSAGSADGSPWLTEDQMVAVAQGMTFADSFEDHATWFAADAGLR